MPTLSKPANHCAINLLARQIPHKYVYKRIEVHWRAILSASAEARLSMQRLLAPREAANILGISYPTLKQWIYRNKLKTVKTPAAIIACPRAKSID